MNIKSLIQYVRRRLSPTPLLLPEPPRHGVMAVRSTHDDIQTIINKPDPVIVDGGANIGDMTHHYQNLFADPQISAFEPIPALVKHLEKRFADDSQVTIYPYALGATNQEVEFNVNNFDATSSILNASSHNMGLCGEMVDLKEKISVPMVRLDSVRDVSKRIDFVKLDLQGYELEALKGFGDILANTHIILTEVEFLPLYDDQPLFADIDLFMRQADFNLFNLYNLYTHEDGQLYVADALYINNRFKG